MATELAKAYVQIIPTTKGVGNALESELGDASEKAGDSAGQKSGNSFASGFGKVAGVIGKAAIAAVSAAATACAAVVKQSAENYASYQQLAAGSQLLFGDGYDYIAEKAANAFNTVQMSTNDYLEQVNGLATGLKTALGGDGQAAAELADRVISAEADVEAATGASAENVSNAFNGIMKSNYSMLDNLQLGITPTKAGFQEVIDKVNEWNAANGNATSYVIDNLADCQNALVDYISMQGLAGYASDEAFTTISGSLESVKSSWSNLLTGLANPDADLTSLINNLASSISSFAGNIVPVITQALSGISTVIQQVAPLIVAELPNLISTVLPSLLDAVVSLLDSVFAVIPSLLQTLVSVVVQYFPVLVQAILGFLPTLLTTLISMIETIADGIGSMAAILIPAVIQCLVTLATTLVQNLPVILDSLLSMIQQIANALLYQGLPVLLEALPDIISGLVEFVITSIPTILLAVVQIISSIVEMLPTIIEMLIEMIPQIIVSLVMAIASSIPTLLKACISIVTSIIKLAPTLVKMIVTLVPTIVKGLVDGFKGKGSEFKSIGIDVVKGIVNGLKSMISSVKDSVKSIASTITGTFKSILGIASPSKVFKSFGGYIDSGLAVGISANTDEVESAMNELGNSTLQSGLKAVSSNINASVESSTNSNQISPEAIYNAVLKGMEDANINMYVGERQLGRTLKGMGVAFT